MPSPRFVQLREQLDALRLHLLPSEFDPTAAYEEDDGVFTKAIAYRVLAHAEIEAFFEDRALEVVGEARAAWDHGHVSRVAVCLMAFSGKEMQLPPDTLDAPTGNKRKAWPSLVDVTEKFLPITAQFYNFIRHENHGVREKNLLSILLPLGVQCTKLDPAFLADMDSFGALRGVAAHSSGRNSATQQVDPQSELKRIAALLPGIESLDAELDTLLADIPRLRE